jgi:hypothetical protein
MRQESTVVTVTVGEKEFSKTYQKVIYETVDDVLALLQDEKKAAQAIKDLNYGSDLKAKSEVRNSILSENAGPEKAFEKSVKDFMKLREANGKPVTEEQARKFITLSQTMDLAS